MSASVANPFTDLCAIEDRVAALISQMTLAEKIGQMIQRNVGDGNSGEHLIEKLRAGQIGAILNVVDVDVVNALQRVAVEESRLGIPLLVGRDVIHGFKTVMPIPLGQAATWNTAIVKDAARVAALEAATAGINWTFAPMIDISRDPRWGRIAESLGEDPFLTGELAIAMVAGFQGHDMAASGCIAATAKHFAGYGSVESGRDYATTNIPENELRNTYLQPFKAAVDGGVVSLMASFSDLDGVPATGNEFLLRQVLRDEWKFDGFVVSDWDSVRLLQIHGITENEKESAKLAATAGIDLEMAGETYGDHLAALVGEGQVGIDIIDLAVANILRAKFRIGLFENPYTDPGKLPPIASNHALQTAKSVAIQSVVMLKNENDVLPLSVDGLQTVAIIGPLADAPYDQLGTWIFDGDENLSVTPLTAIRNLVGDTVNLRHVAAMETSRSRSTEFFGEAVDAAASADVAVLFLGEESILSGEAHSRADINLPGAQRELVQCIRATGTPIVAVILAGRPLTLTNILDEVDALLFAWHPGTMGGPAIAELLFGLDSPSGKLPVTFPRMVGQIPIYYNQKNGCKPPSPETIVHIDDIDAHAPQLSTGMTAFHLDAGYTPLFPFGYGLSYTTFSYEDIRLSASEIHIGESLTVSAVITNQGNVAATEIVQLYTRDLVGSVTRPVLELKGFQRIRLEPRQSQIVEFRLHTDMLAFYSRNMKLTTEPGEFHVWIGGSSQSGLRANFRITAND